MLRTISRTFSAMRIKGRQFGGDERGSVVTFLVVVPVLAGTVAIGVETGQLYRVKRQMQSAADAAALAGSIDRINGVASATITSDARYEAQRNGFTNGVNTISVTVNTPPTSGAFTNSTSAVEVVITKTQTFSLGAVINSWMGVANNGFTMRARSVAAQGTFTQTASSGEGCIVALTTAAEQGVSFTSFNNFDSDCSIISNGTATGTGSNASVNISNFNNATMKQVWARGSYSVSSYNHVTPLPSQALTNQSTAVADPTLTKFPTNPSPGACSYGPATPFTRSSQSSVTVSPGTYCGGMEITSVSNVYFTPGIYYIADGDLYLHSVSNVSCPSCTADNGVAIVLTTTSTSSSTVASIGGLYISSDNNVTLNAGKSNTGLYTGTLVYQDRRASVGTMSSTSKILTITSLNNVTLSGAIYFPNNRIDISSVNNFGGDSTTGCTIWVGRYIKFSSFNNDYKGGCDLYGTSPVNILTTSTVSKATVVE